MIRLLGPLIMAFVGIAIIVGCLIMDARTELRKERTSLATCKAEAGMYKQSLTKCQSIRTQCLQDLKAQKSSYTAQIQKLTSKSKGLYVMFPCDQGREGLCFGPYPGPSIMTQQ